MIERMGGENENFSVGEGLKKEKAIAGDKQRKREKHFDSLVKYSSDIIVILERDGITRYASPLVERILGYKPEDLVGKNAFEYVHPEDRPGALAKFGNTIREPGIAVPIELRIKHLNGSWVYFEVIANNLTNDSNVQGIVLNARDITKRKQAENALRKSEKKFRAMVEHSTDIITIVDGEGKVKFITPSVKSILGYNPEDLIGGSAFDLGHPNDLKTIFESLIIKNPRIPLRTESRFKDNNGSWCIMEATWCNLLDDPIIEGIVVNFHDITERKLAEDGLRESEEKYRLHFENISDVIFSFDTEGVILNVSPSVERLVGYTPDELVGRPFYELDILAQGFCENDSNRIMDFFSGEQVDPIEVEVTSKDGTKKVVEINFTPLLRDGDLVSIISVARDITERKRTEEKLKGSLEERDILFKELRHRVKNNLQLLSSMVDMQAMRSHNYAYLKKLQEIQSVIETMALIYSRAYEETRIMDLNLNNFIRELIGGLMKFKVNEDSKIDYTVSGDYIRLTTDQVIPLALIANELVFNALKHAFVGRNEGHISVCFKEYDKTVSMSISDDGVGLSSDFDIEKTDSLGLKIVRNLTEQLRGRLDIVGEAGTKFILEVPKEVV